MSAPNRTIETDQRIVEDRQTLLSILLELTVAASNLFDPNAPISEFLERVSERLGCAVALCVEMGMGKSTDIKLVDSIGLSHEMQKSPLSVIFSLLKESQLEKWNFSIPIEDAEVVYYLQLYFDINEQPKQQYHGMIERLLITLKRALSHRRLYQKTLDQKALLAKDITEIKKSEQERGLLLVREIQARAEAEAERGKIAKALSIRDEFISIASHELKTPLTSLRLQLQMIRVELKKYQMEEQRAEAFCQSLARKLNISEQQVERLIILIFGLLDVSKIQAGKLSLEAQEVNLSHLLSDIVTRFSDQFKAAGNTVGVNIDPDVIGFWDPFRIEQVINNLIVNAIKFGASKPIEITLKKGNEWAYLSVKDYGVGIKSEHQKLIFEKYERILSSSKVTGLGLGLYIARQIILHHGGSIHVESAPQEGSTFTVNLPLDHSLG